MRFLLRPIIGRVVILGAGVLVCARAASAQTPPPSQSAAPSAAPAAPPSAATASPASDNEASQAKEQARAHLRKGIDYHKQEQWGAALTEFLEARRLYPQMLKASTGAAFCLQKLQRYDEALDMTEALFRDYADELGKESNKDVKDAAERLLAAMQDLVGTVEINGAEAGASIIIDGRYRGTSPLNGPLRIGVGRHEIRAYKEGFDPFGASVEIKGKEHAEATLRSLSTGGRLRVTEQRGRVLDVVVDGTVVGKTPWEGSVAVGEHSVLLRGNIDLDALTVCSREDVTQAPGKLASTPLTQVELGTQPVRVSVKLREREVLMLTAESLDTWIRIEPTPAGATVAIDSEVVGRGTWEGRLRVGEHKVEVAAEGFVPQIRQVSLEGRKRQLVKVQLERDPISPLWQTPGSLVPAGVAYGVGVAGLGVFAVTGILAINKTANVRSQCQDNVCPTSQEDAIRGVRTLGTASTIGLVVAGLGLGTGTVLLFKRPGAGPLRAPAKSGRPQPAGGVSFSVGAGLGRFEVQGRF